MKRLCLMLAVFCGCFAQPQPQQPPLTRQNPPVDTSSSDRLPNGKSQREMIVKDDYKKNLEESAELAKLAEDLKADLENSDKYVVSVKTMKKTEDIEKLARSIRNRLKEY